MKMVGCSKKYGKSAAAFLVCCLLLPAGDLSAVTFRAMDDLTVSGTGGTVPNPDLEVKGFSIFGSTNVVTRISTAPGNVVFNGAVQVSSDIYIVGLSTFAGNAFFLSSITVSAISGLAAPLTGDAAATKGYVDSALDICALGTAGAGDILQGKTADIDCDNFAEAGTYVARYLPDTGQSAVYSAGDDGTYNPAATQLSYTDNGDGTITDNVTGLMWKKCSEPDTTTGCGGAHNTYNWANALSQCEGLVYPSGIYSDWRLPNVKELFSIVKFSGAAPFIDAAYFPSTLGDYYWTSTSYAPNSSLGMNVDFSQGFANSVGDKTTVHYVRCVRAGP